MGLARKIQGSGVIGMRGDEVVRDPHRISEAILLEQCDAALQGGMQCVVIGVRRCGHRVIRQWGRESVTCGDIDGRSAMPAVGRR